MHLDLFFSHTDHNSREFDLKAISSEIHKIEFIDSDIFKIRFLVLWHNQVHLHHLYSAVRIASHFWPTNIIGFETSQKKNIYMNDPKNAAHMALQQQQILISTLCLGLSNATQQSPQYPQQQSDAKALGGATTYAESSSKLWM